MTLALHTAYPALGLTAITIFVIGYFLVITEELNKLRKSKPMVMAASIMWIVAALAAQKSGLTEQATQALQHIFLEFTELFFFLVVAMTYVNAIEERQVFAALRSWLLQKKLSYCQLFWITGMLAFFISPIADNMTTALVMGTLVTILGKAQPTFISLSCINIVIAANAGGAFCPFGDITTLMVWQKGVLNFHEFFKLFLPSLISYLIPACLMYFAVPKTTPASVNENVQIAPGGMLITLLFLFTIFMTVILHHFLHLPPVISMMTGLGLLQIYGYFIKCHEQKSLAHTNDHFDIFRKIKNIEWDTLLFFYGVMLSIGALAFFGYLELLSTELYQEWGKSLDSAYQQLPANVIIGILSAIIDNIPLMFAILTMHPEMSHGQWLLATLTTGIGGSLLSVGSAAGVALMGQAKGYYTFFSHLKWSWAIFLGYAAAITVHIWLNSATF